MLTSLEDDFFNTRPTQQLQVNIEAVSRRVPIDHLIDILLEKLSANEAQQLLRHCADELDELL